MHATTRKADIGKSYCVIMQINSVSFYVSSLGDKKVPQIGIESESRNPYKKIFDIQSKNSSVMLSNKSIYLHVYAD